MGPDGWGNQPNLSGHIFRLEKQIYLTTFLPDLFPKTPGMNRSLSHFYEDHPCERD